MDNSNIRNDETVSLGYPSSGPVVLSQKAKPFVVVMTSLLTAGACAVVVAATLLSNSGGGGVDAAPPSAAVLDANERGFNKEEFLAARQRLIRKDARRAIGAGLKLNAQEKKLDEILVKEKKKLIESARLGRTEYIPAQSFYKSKPWMEKTTIFKIIKKMPKGAALHIHESATVSLDWLVKNATYRDKVFMCIDKDGFILLNAFTSMPKKPACSWTRVEDLREKAENVDEFDKMLLKNISMLTTDPLEMYPSVNKIWVRFNKYFEQVSPAIYYMPIMRDYYRQALQEFWEDNVQYLEMRALVDKVFTYDHGMVYNATIGMQMFKQVTDQFVHEHSDFFGAGIIMTGLKFRDVETITEEVKTAMKLRKQFPDIFLGYDLVAQEGKLKPLIDYADALLYPTLVSQADKLPYFLHAGETKWQGTQVDENLADALLLNTTRIGHGFALPKHPELAEEVKRRGIAVEVNPISNQLLSLVTDLRNHPMVPLLADDFPIIISSDDPAAWEALPMTHDFYVAYMNMCGEDAGLAFLKQLAINSFKYSSLNKSRKKSAMKLWQTKWDKFVDEAVAEFGK